MEYFHFYFILKKLKQCTYLCTIIGSHQQFLFQRKCNVYLSVNDVITVNVFWIFYHLSLYNLILHWQLFSVVMLKNPFHGHSLGFFFSY